MRHLWRIINGCVSNTPQIRRRYSDHRPADPGLVPVRQTRGHRPKPTKGKDCQPSHAIMNTEKESIASWNRYPLCLECEVANVKYMYIHSRTFINLWKVNPKLVKNERQISVGINKKKWNVILKTSIIYNLNFKHIKKIVA